MLTSHARALRLLCGLLPLGLAACAAPDEADAPVSDKRLATVCAPGVQCLPSDEPPEPPPPLPPPNLRVRILNGASEDPASPYCAADNDEVRFVIENVSQGVARPSTYRFTDVGSGAQSDYPTPPLGPGRATGILTRTFERGHPGGSGFTIQADVHHVVFESQEGDNQASGACPD